MDIGSIVIGIVVLYILHKLVLVPLKKIIGNAVFGGILYWLVNTYGGAYGIAPIPVDAVSLVLICIFGVPGVVVLSLYYSFIH